MLMVTFHLPGHAPWTEQGEKGRGGGTDTIEMTETRNLGHRETKEMREVVEEGSGEGGGEGSGEVVEEEEIGDPPGRMAKGEESSRTNWTPRGKSELIIPLYTDVM